MLAGLAGSDTALAHARELLDLAQDAADDLGRAVSSDSPARRRAG